MSLNRTLLQAISKKMDKPSKPKVPRNQWQHPGEVTKIPSNNITMQGVGFPVMGVPNVGQPQMMMPGQDYYFPGAGNVTEYPMMQPGGQTIAYGDNTRVGLVPRYARPGNYRGQMPDTLGENILEIFDPSGITSWDDVYRSAIDSGMSGATALEAFGAIPMLGKAKKFGQLVDMLSTGLAITKRQKRNAKAAAELLKATGKYGPAVGRASDAYQAYDQYAKGGYIMQEGGEQEFYDSASTDQAYLKTIDNYKPITKGDVNSVRSNMAKYISSPLYAQRQANYPENYLGDAGSYQKRKFENAIAQVKQRQRLGNLQNTPYQIGSNEYAGSHFDTGSNKLFLNNIADTQTIAHETAHSLARNNRAQSDYVNGRYWDSIVNKQKLPDFSTGLNQQEVQQFVDLARPLKPNSLGVNDPHDDKTTNPVSFSQESYGDLMGVRELLHKKGYTKNFGDNITKELMDKAVKDKSIYDDFIFRRMHNKYGSDNMIHLNNTIAYNNAASTTNPMARYGGVLNYYQVGGENNPDQIITDAAKSALGFLGDVVSFPARAVVKGLTGKYQDPSEALGISNPIGAFLTDAVLDPTNLVGAGLAAKVLKGTGKATKVVKAADKVTDAVKAVSKATGPRKIPIDPADFNKASQATIDALTQRGQYLDKITGGRLKLTPDDIQYHGTYSGRPIVEVNTPNGPEYFYKSTGWAQKSQGTVPGQWQAFGQFMDAPAGTLQPYPVNNWFVKGHDYKNWYGSQAFKNTANDLDNLIMQKYGVPQQDVNRLLNFQNMQGDVNTFIPKKEYGGHGGLDRWFAEKWVDVKSGKPCGRQEGESRKGYPACRPSKRINEDTPKTSSELSSSEREKFKREKTSSDRIDYQHRRREFGGEQMYNDMEQYKSGGNVPTNPALWSRAKSMARQKYDVYPSAYANGWAAKWYKSKGGGWRKAEFGMEIPMAQEGLENIRDKNGYIDIAKHFPEVGDNTVDKDWVAKAEMLNKMYPNSRFVCTAKGCADIATSFARAKGYDFGRNHAWALGNQNPVTWTNPNYEGLIGAGILPDPTTYAVPDYLNGLDEGYLVGLNRVNNSLDSKGRKATGAKAMAKTQKDANDSGDYGPRLYKDSRGYEHTGYVNAPGQLVHGTGAGKNHPAYLIFDNIKDGIKLNGIAPYEPVEVMREPGAASFLSHFFKNMFQQGGSIYDYMTARGMDGSYAGRKKMFDKYFAGNYTGTAAQNQAMLAMLQGQQPQARPAARPVAARAQAAPARRSNGMVNISGDIDNRNWFERTLGMNEDEIQHFNFQVPQDVANYYNQYKGKNKGKKFGIVSKQNARGYFFDENGNLVLQDEVGLGKDKGDAQPVFYKTMTTPSGEYTMNRAPDNKTAATDYASHYGSKNMFYINHTDPNKRLIPDPANPGRKVTQAVHGVPTHLEKERLPKFDNNNVDDNRMSAGCINCRKQTLDNPYFTNIPQNVGLSLYVTPEKKNGGSTFSGNAWYGDGGSLDNPGFRALPPAVQQKIMDNMAEGGEKMPESIARARFAAAGNLDRMDDYGYAYGGSAQQAAIAIAMKKAGKTPKSMAKGGQPDGDMALTQINAVMDKLSKLKQFIQPDTDLEPWESSKFAVMDHYADALYDNMMFSPENEEQMAQMQIMAEGGIPERYKNMGFTKVGVKKNSTRPGKKWMVLAKKGDDYKVVHGGYDGMKDFSQHGSEQRKENFWNRMGGKNSSKATDPFSPLYWHKKFGTWADGGQFAMGGMPCFECGGMMKMGGQPQVGDEMEVTPEQMAELKKQGYTFEVI